MIVVAGPTGDYIQPEVDAIKKYVEGGGRALFMLDPPLRLGRKQISDNQALWRSSRQAGALPPTRTCSWTKAPHRNCSAAGRKRPYSCNMTRTPS